MTRTFMSLIRKASTLSSPPPKRLKLDGPQLLNYKDAVVLAPMVRSSTCKRSIFEFSLLLIQNVMWCYSALEVIGFAIRS